MLITKEILFWQTVKNKIDKLLIYIELLGEIPFFFLIKRYFQIKIFFFFLT